MYILLTGFMILNLLFSFVDWIVVGDTQLNATTLVTAVSANTTTLRVSSTGGFYVADYVTIGNEEIKYNGISSTEFLYCSRGYKGTTAATHNVGDKVYGRVSADINASVGFNIVNTGASVGSINIATESINFVKKTLPSMISWNFYWMKSGFWQYLRLVCFAISTGLIFVVVIQLLSALGGVLQRAFV